MIDIENFPSIGGVMVSKMIIDDRKKPLFIYREKPVNEQDSGWRIFSGFESQEYVNDPENTGIYAPATVLEIDPSIADLLVKPVGSVFERDDEDSEWYDVNDFELEDDYLVVQKLTKKWEIELSNLFVKQQNEEGDLIFSMKGKTIQLAVWKYGAQTKEELLAHHKDLQKHRDEEAEPIIESFEFDEGEVLRVGYMIKLQDAKKSYHVIHGFSIIDEEVIQSAICFNEEVEKEWAVNVWRSIKTYY